MGSGNDFVVIEARIQPFEPSADQVRAIARRQGGVGLPTRLSQLLRAPLTSPS